MTKSRLEAFSDGVMAVIITIMVLELKAPDAADWHALLGEVGATLCVYILSFVFVAIYWNNHHHLMHTVDRINGAILWANMHLLFWLSLVPFVTAWMGRTRGARVPTATYGVVLLMCAVAWTILQHCIITLQGRDSKLSAAVGRDVKGKASAALYVAAIPLALVDHWIADAIFIFVALMWLVPDRRIESRVPSPGA